MRVRLSRDGGRVINATLVTSVREHGTDAAERYLRLIATTIEMVGEQPLRPGAIAIPRARDVYVYPLRLARERLPRAQRVGNPRHLLAYRVETEVVVILGLVHENMQVARAARRLARKPDEP